MDLKEIPLGYEVRDKITGFKGLAVAKLVFLNGCVQYSLKPKLDKDSKMVDASVFDSQQVEIIGMGIVKKVPKPKPTGGDMPDTPIIK